MFYPQTYSDVTGCANCSAPSKCLSGLYMPPGQCPGNTTKDATCSVCRALACPFGTYQRPCYQNTDTACVNYTQCKAGVTTLRNRGQFYDGVCMNCTNCTKFNLTTVLNCSQYQDTLCSGTPCSGASPCPVLADRSYYCDFGAYGTQTVNRTSPGVCGMCPDGYSSDGLFCYECPRSKTCTRFGAVQCQGEVSVGLEPWCYGEFAQPTGSPCPFPADPSRIVTRSTFIRPNGNCAPYFQCAPGYYKHFYSVGSVLCEPCMGVVPQNFAWFSGGLSVNDPLSCLFECARIGLWPNGTCNRPAVTSYIPANPAGYYDDGSGAVRPCPGGYTSLARQSVSGADCVPCFAPAGTLGDQCGDWTCQYPLTKIGDACFNLDQCSFSVGYTQATTGVCQPSRLPWQPAGWLKTSGPDGADVMFLTDPTAAAQPASVVLVVGGPGASGNLTFYSAGYGQSGRHWLQTSGQRIALPARACAAASLVVSGRAYALLAFCNASFLSFLDLSTKAPTPRLLIGSSVAGYQEGFRDDALFGQQLFIAVASEGSIPRVYVADQLNCALRLVSIPGYPGDFVTRSYWVYGSSVGTCKTIPLSIIYPGRLFGALSQRFFLFPAIDGLYQLDSGTRTVVQAFSLSQAPAWLPDLSLLIGIELGSNGTNATELRLRFANFTAVVVPNQQRCADGSTSSLGGSCNIKCPVTVSYVDPVTGACLSCATRMCNLGEQNVPCTANSAQTCVLCPPPMPLQGLYPRVYSLPGSCSMDNTYFVSYCPPNYYLTATPASSGGLICARCPRFSATAGDGATSIDQCRCFPGTTRGAGGACLVGQLYPLPSVTSCPLGTYPRGVFERCTSCRVDPFPECPVGQYPMLNGSCLPCVLPFHAAFTTNGKGLSVSTSCGFDCLPGFYQKSGVIFLLQCQPCTNAPAVGSSGAGFYAVTNGQLDAPLGCTWACLPPFKAYLGQCVPCALANPVHPGMPCTHPWLAVNASAGNGTTGVLAGVAYRFIRFNASGYFVFSQNVTVDILVVAGGGAGGGVPSWTVGAGGGGGAGQVVLAYNLSVSANVVYTVSVGKGGTGYLGSFGNPAGSSSIKPSLLTNAYLGGGGAPPGNKGATGASGGGSGSGRTDYPNNSLTSFQGGPGLTNLAGGGGGSACQGGVSSACQSGNGGCGTVLSANTPMTFFDPVSNLILAGGGGGGSAMQGCPAGAGAAGGGAGAAGASADGQSALPNTGSGGGGGSVNGAGALNGAKGGDGGSGLVVVRFLDESCACA